MGLFRKKDRVIDLTEHYRKQQERIQNIQEEAKSVQTGTANSEPQQGSFFGGFFGGGNSSTSANNETESSTSVYGSPESINPEERRRRLAKRLKEMSDKIESLSNSIYHLEQRIEVLERKTHTNIN